MAKSIVIVGSGIIGAAFALHMALAGASVTLVERMAAPGGLATPASWAWINASFFNAEPYARLRQRAIADWHALAGTLPALAPEWPGSLLWDPAHPDLSGAVARHAAWGYDCAMIPADEVARREPNLIAPPGPAAFSRAEGVINPIKATTALLAAAERHGAVIRTDLAATALETLGGRVTGITTAQGSLTADEVVLCNGVGANGLLAPLGRALRMANKPGLVVLSHRVPAMLNHLAITPGMELRQDRAGRVIAAGDLPEGSETDPLETALTLFADLRLMLRGGAGLRMATHRAAVRPITADGLPAFGRPAGIAGLWLAVTHSGVTLAPLLARLGTADILQGQTDPLTKPYAPDRLLG